MSKVLIVGPSGSGKTFVSSALRKRGINAVDADSVVGLSGWFDGMGNKVNFPEDADKEFLDNHEFLWNLDFLRMYLDSQKEVFFFGLSGNVFDAISLFDRAYWLNVEPAVLRENLRHETRKNPMGKTEYQLNNVLKFAKDVQQKAKRLGLRVLNVTNKSAEEIFELINS